MERSIQIIRATSVIKKQSRTVTQMGEYWPNLVALLLISKPPFDQGCQMVYFKTKNLNLCLAMEH
jgi:hypothetical protein